VATQLIMIFGSTKLRACKSLRFILESVNTIKIRPPVRRASVAIQKFIVKSIKEVSPIGTILGSSSEYFGSSSG
jgi:hypothetical protein